MKPEENSKYYRKGSNNFAPTVSSDNRPTVSILRGTSLKISVRYRLVFNYWLIFIISHVRNTKKSTNQRIKIFKYLPELTTCVI